MLSDIIKKHPEGPVARAYKFAQKAHEGQRRKTNEPYFVHPKATAETLLNWRLDEPSVVAGLLHDVVEDTGITLEDVRKNFGDEVAFLVDGVTKIGRIKYRGAEMKIENLRKMIFALSEDLRVVFIKLADRLHNMQTLNALPPQKQKRIALETEEIYAPIAYRLGMQSLSGQLHDLAFPYIYPNEDRWLKANVKDAYAAREKYLAKLRPVLEKALKERGLVPLTIDLRAKRYSSLYHKLLLHNMDIDKIYDLVAMRVIMKTVEDCYSVLGIVHQLWPPLPGRIKDYIAMPKPNSYRSLHTTVIGADGKYVEIQIRTKEMHDENENGIASHWVYDQAKRSSEKKSAKAMTEEIQWVQQLRRWQETHPEANSEAFLRSMKIDFFKDRIFAITPEGDVIDLPKGSTPVDFAYEIHSDIGNSCVGAKVNDQFASLDHELQNGDLVYILTQKGKKPSEDWLDFVKTASAKEHIRAALKGKDQKLVSREPKKADLKIVIETRVGLIKDISSIIAQSHFSISGINMAEHKSGNYPVLRVQIDSADKRKIEKLLLKIKRIKEVKEISYSLI